MEAQLARESQRTKVETSTSQSIRILSIKSTNRIKGRVVRGACELELEEEQGDGEDWIIASE
jgi:hypothetical protein